MSGQKIAAVYYTKWTDTGTNIKVVNSSQWGSGIGMTCTELFRAWHYKSLLHTVGLIISMTTPAIGVIIAVEVIAAALEPRGWGA